MKALTLTQPYATLVADGMKRWETRSWRTTYGGPLAIHAAATFSGVGGRRAFDQILLDLPSRFRDRLEFYYGVGPARILDLPLGALVGVTWVEDVDRTEAVRADLDEEELAVGDYGDGRYAWKLREPIGVAPVAVRGRQGLWRVSDELIPEYARLAIRHPGVA